MKKRTREVLKMSDFRTINLTFSESDFQKLKHCKEMYEKKSMIRITWENFVFAKVCGK
jgi:hypothetical protein